MPRRLALLSLLVWYGLVAALPTLAANRYTIIDLGTLGGDGSRGEALNNLGQVTGYSKHLTGGGWHAFLYDGTNMHDLGTLGGTHSYGLDINDAGQVTGSAYLPGDGTYHAFLYDGAMHDLGTLSQGWFSGPQIKASEGRGINNNGQVTGYTYAEWQVGNTRWGGPNRAFFYDGSMHLFDLRYGPGNDINDVGQVTGQLNFGPGATHAFLYGAMYDLGTLGGTTSEGLRINNAGQITGTSTTAGNAATHAFFYDGSMHDLGTLGGTHSYGLGINNQGHVVGYSDVAEGGDPHAFLYREGNLIDLNSLIDPLLGWDLYYASAINDAGQITGAGWINGQSHAYLLTPVPEPGTYLLTAIALAALVLSSQRRS